VSGPRAKARCLKDCLATFLLAGESPMFRTALIALALALASCASGQAERAPVHAQSVPNADTLHPYAIMCAAPGAPHGWISVPAGRNPTDFCPKSSITARIYQHSPNVNYPVPTVSGAAPPANWASLQMQQDNLARRQLDNLRASKLQNKTPGQPP
jgi:hypothetical protein